MNLNLTLLGQMLTFSFFIWVTMKYVWPFIMQAMTERQATIADGLAAGERGRQELELAQQKSIEIIRQAKQEAQDIAERADKQGVKIIDASKVKAKEEGARQLQLAKAEILQEKNKARLTLRREVAEFAIKGAEKILQRQVDEAANSQLLDKLIEEI